MADSRSIPRLLQRPSAPGESTVRPAGAHEGPVPDHHRRKGDVRTQVEATKPSRDRETGDLDSDEREAHGQA